jgi:APA family basic amino acid/polyamine antiporter
VSAPPAATAPAPGLIRGIRRWDLLALMVNATIGAGIFGLPSRVHALVGAWSLPAFVACAALVAIVILCFAEVASRFESTGGPYLYAREAFGPLVGFVMGLLLWLVRLSSFAALCNLLVSYLHVLWPAADSEPWRTLVIVAVTAGLATINFIGVRNAAVVGNAFAIGKLIPLAVLIGVGLAAVEPARLALGALPAAGAFPKAMLLLVFAFTGFELVIIPAGEANDPRRNLPWALLSGLAVVAVVYVLIQVVCMGTMPELATSTRPLADAAGIVMGRAGAALLAIGALLSIIGSLGATMLAAPRLPYAMAEHGELPRLLAATHPRFRTPWAGILLSAVFMLALSLSSSFVGALTISTVTRIITYISTCIALLVLRRRPGAPAAAFRAPMGGALAVLAGVTCLWLLSSVTGREAGMVGLAALVALALYALRRLRF